MSKRKSVNDGLFRQNIVLMSGLYAGPVIAGADNFSNAVSIAFVFTLVSFITISMCRFVPKRIVYAVRIVIYALVSAAVYIPVYYLASKILGQYALDMAGIYIPILATNPLILTKTEVRLFHRPYPHMLLETISYIAGFDLVCLLIGMVRDALANGRIGWLKVDMPLRISAVETCFGGFFLIGIAAALFRYIYSAACFGTQDPQGIQTPVQEAATNE